MRRFSKLTTITVGTVAAVAVSGIAYAYWTAGGSGTGSATTGDVVPITVNQTSVMTPLAPGLDAVPLSGNFDNPNTSPIFVGNVVAALSVTPAAGGTCDTSDYTLVQPAPVGAEVQPGASQGAWGGGSIAFNNKTDANQDGCKGAALTLSYTIS